METIYNQTHFDLIQHFADQSEEVEKLPNDGVRFHKAVDGATREFDVRIYLVGDAFGNRLMRIEIEKFLTPTSEAMFKLLLGQLPIQQSILPMMKIAQDNATSPFVLLLDFPEQWLTGTILDELLQMALTYAASQYAHLRMFEA